MKFFHISMLIMICSVMIGLLPDLFKYTIDQNNARDSQAFVLEANDDIKAKSFVIMKNGKKIPVYLAKSEAERIRGLSGLYSMPDRYGMLFVFEYSDYQSMWMKDMLFPIDTIWIDEDYKIVHIEKNISPNTYPKIFTSPVKASFVLELNASAIESYNLKNGDSISLELK